MWRTQINPKHPVSVAMLLTFCIYCSLKFSITCSTGLCSQWLVLLASSPIDLNCLFYWHLAYVLNALFYWHLSGLCSPLSCSTGIRLRFLMAYSTGILAYVLNDLFYWHLANVLNVLFYWHLAYVLNVLFY